MLMMMKLESKLHTVPIAWKIYIVNVEVAAIFGCQAVTQLSVIEKSNMN